MTAAFFDLDGTLLSAPSLERRYLQYLRWRGDLKLGQWFRAAFRMIPIALRAHWSWETRDAGEGEWAVMLSNNKAYLAGVPCWTMNAFSAWLQRYPTPLLADARRRVEWHIEQGHAVVLVTGAPAPLASALAREIHPAIQVLATGLESDQGHWTGRITGRAMTGIEKSRTIVRFAAAHHWHLQDCFAYGDSGSDRWMLRRVGHPVAVNPDRRLEKLAREEGWPVARWASVLQRKPIGHLATRKHFDFVERLRATAQKHGYALFLHSPPATLHEKEPRGQHPLRTVEESPTRPAC